MSFSLLVVAKAPVPGFAKTRLCPPASPEQAALIAASALLDTLEVVRATPGALPVVALTGDLESASRGGDIADALQAMTVFPQRGNDFAERLANAHADTSAANPGIPVLQIGMDTPQLTPELLTAAGNRLSKEHSVIGMAEDGGWWALGLRDPAEAALLADVPMSMSDTGERTRRALGVSGLLPQLSDVDTMDDALRVAERAPHGRFAAAVGEVAVGQ